MTSVWRSIQQIKRIGRFSKEILFRFVCVILPVINTFDLTKELSFQSIIIRIIAIIIIVHVIYWFLSRHRKLDQ